jgi:hypothetical protein
VEIKRGNMSTFEGTPHIPEQPDDYEQAREIDALGQDCQDVLEQDERYRERSKRFRNIAPEWAGADGILYQANLKGRHVITPGGRYIGQMFELGLNATYPIIGMIPRELSDHIAAQQQMLPPVERIGAIETKYSINIYLDPIGSLAWQEARHYDVCYEVDKDDIPEEALSMMAEDEDGETDEADERYVTEEQFTVPLNSGSSNSQGIDRDEPDADVLRLLEADISGIQPSLYVHFGRQILTMVMAEDEGSLLLSRIYPEEVISQILPA